MCVEVLLVEVLVSEVLEVLVLVKDVLKVLVVAVLADVFKVERAAVRYCLCLQCLCWNCLLTCLTCLCWTLRFCECGSAAC